MTIPFGTVITYVGSAARLNSLEEEGWLNCDGRSQLTTEYPELYRAIQTSYGGGGNTFKLPNLQGMFLRGVDPTGLVDPDYDKRTSPDSTDPTVVGPIVGSRQIHQLASHEHFWDSNFGQITHSGNDINVQLALGQGDAPNLGRQPTTNFDGGGKETRPSNVYAYFLIFAGVATSRRHKP